MGGVAMVVAATMLLAALVGGLQRMLASTGEPDNLIVLRKGATSDGAGGPRREGFGSGGRLRVAPGTDGRALGGRIESDGRFTPEAKPEADYYREQAETANALYILVLTLGIAMAVGATFGALNTMYAAVAARTAEIGTLRALGFSRGAVLASFLTESCLLAAGGLLVGAA